MREQSSTLSKRLLASAVPALALLSVATVAYAGDPIQVSGDKSKPGSVDARPVDADVFKSLNKSKGPALKGLTPLVVPGQSVDPKEERRLKNVRDERKNWMLLEPGELQKRDDEEQGKFGGRSVALDSTDDDDSRNYLLIHVTQQKSDKAKSQPRNAAPADSEDEPKKDGRPTFSVLGQRDQDKQGAHTVSELNLKGLIDPSQVNAAKFNQNEASLFQFFKENSPAGADRDQQARRENFREFINGPQPGASSSGLSDPINFRTDLTQERMNPIMPSRGFEPAAPKPMDLPRASLGAAFDPVRAQSLPDIINAAPRQATPGPYLPSPLLMNDASRSPRPSLMDPFNPHAPRRGGI